MDPVSQTFGVIGVIGAVRQLQEDILRVHDRIFGDKQVARSLETSQQKLQIWQETWGDNNIDTTTSTALWGTQGLTEIQKLLRTISNTVQKIENADRERSKIKSRPSFFNNEKIQVTKQDGVDTKSQSPWKRALQKISAKKSLAVTYKPLTMLELATELNSSIDELWTYSEVAFNSVHGLLATRAVGSPSGHSTDSFLADAIRTRAASIALYRACSKSTRECSLEVSVLRAETLRSRAGPGSADISSSLFFHLSTQSRDSPAEMRHMTIESIVRPGTPVTKNSEIEEYENPDLTVFDMKSASDLGFFIRPKIANTTKSYFRVAKSPANVILLPETQNLAQILYKEKVSSTTSSARTLPFSVRIELAYNLVECALHLLGTPWLASLNSKRLRRINVEDGRRPYVLEVQTLDLDELSFEDPEALAEPSQLFRIGVLLVEIALSNPEHSAPTEIRELDLRKSKMLTLVQQSMGPQYCKATAFCLHDRGSTPHFGRPEKYQYPEKTGWKPYLLELLQDYHAHVFLR